MAAPESRWSLASPTRSECNAKDDRLAYRIALDNCARLFHLPTFIFRNEFVCKYQAIMMNKLFRDQFRVILLSALSIQVADWFRSWPSLFIFLVLARPSVRCVPPFLLFSRMINNILLTVFHTFTDLYARHSQRPFEHSLPYVFVRSSLRTRQREKQKWKEKDTEAVRERQRE